MRLLLLTHGQKNCEAKFAEIATSPSFNFFGNVKVGETLPLRSLRENYDAILFAYGASLDRKLGIPGEDLDGVYSAREFVGWYNGLPEFAGLAPDLESGDAAVVIGQGNVALDVARVLLSDVDRLKNTDISEAALEALRKSRIRRVRVLGRRGPMQAAFTIKEVRELMQLPDVCFEPLDPALLPPKDVELPRAPKRIAQLLAKHSTSAVNASASKRFSLEFLYSPQAFQPQASTPDKLGGVELQRNQWTDGSTRFQKNAQVLGTSQITTIQADVVFRSIGYKAEPLPGMESAGVQFDRRAGRLLNDGGRLLSEEGGIAEGLYCAGWVKSGPTGVIATTMEDAFATAELISKDWSGRDSSKQGSAAIRDSLRNAIDWYGWQRIDIAERARGSQWGKEREKFRSVKEMLEAA